MTKRPEEPGRSTFRPAPAWSEPSRKERSSPLPALLAALVLATVAVVALWPARRGEFLGSDHALFSRSPFLTAPPARGAAPPPVPAWAPRAVTTLSLAADRAVWGPLPAGFRVTNIALHALATALLFSLCLRWSGRLWIAASAGLLFAVHPLHAEAVDIAGHRGEILASIFIFLSLLALRSPAASGRSGGARSSAGALASALFACVAATFSSPVGLTLPFIVAGLDLLDGPPPVEVIRRRGGVWLLFVAVSLPAAAASIVATQPPSVRDPWLAERAFLEGLRTLFVPYPLPFYRIAGSVRGFDPVWILFAVSSALVLGAALFLCWRGRPLGGEPPDPAGARGAAAEMAGGPRARLAIPRAWHLPVLLAAAGLFAAARFPSLGAGPGLAYPLPDHRLYLASAGACWLIPGMLALAARLAGARTAAARGRAAFAGSAVLAILFAFLIAPRHAAFADESAFWAAVSAELPRSSAVRLERARAQASRALASLAALPDEAAARGRLAEAISSVQRIVEEEGADPDLRLQLADLLRDARDLDGAEKEAREALRLDPSLARAHLTLGLIARERGSVEAAEAAYREAIRLDPFLAEAHSNLGALLAAHGPAGEALAELKTAVELDPTLGDAAANLASFLIEQHQPEEALAVLRDGLRWSETNARLHYNLGVLFQSQGDRSRAVLAYENAIRLDPGYARPKNNLATLFVDLKRFDEAISLLREVVGREPMNERAHYNLGVALRAKGDTRGAAEEFAAALRINPGYLEASRALTALFSPSGVRP